MGFPSLGDKASCHEMAVDETCGGCGWRCECVSCLPDSNDEAWSRCRCTCQFWVISCFVVSVGFSVLIYFSIVYRRWLLCVLSTLGLVASVVLCMMSLAIKGKACSLPAAASLVLAFLVPAVYSCLSRLQGNGHGCVGRLSTRDGLRGRSRLCAGCGAIFPLSSGLCLWCRAADQQRRSTTATPAEPSQPSKTSDATVIVFPGGEVQLGVMEKEVDESLDNERRVHD